MFGASSCKQGETKQEALNNLKEAIAGYLEVNAQLNGKGKSRKNIVDVKIMEKKPAEVNLSKEKIKDIKKSVEEMKKGDYVSLDELKKA
jgi:hypothetical protein